MKEELTERLKKYASLVFVVLLLIIGFSNSNDTVLNSGPWFGSIPRVLYGFLTCDLDVNSYLL
eukprot:9439585-Pyramimonas_sp.AAC.1